MRPKRKLVAAGNCKKICSVSYLLEHSKINLDCSENDLKNLSELVGEQRVKLDKALNRKLGNGKNICNVHLLALTTNLKRHGDCLAEYHQGSKRLSTKNLKNVHTVGDDLSEHIHKTNGFLLPVGGFICNKCYIELNETNPLPKKKKLEPRPKPELNPEPKQEPKVKVFNRGDTLSSLTLRAPKAIKSAPYISPNSNSNIDSSEPGSSKSDKSFHPDSQDVQDVRVKNLNELLENNFKEERFDFRNDKDKKMEEYSRQTIGQQMKVVASGLEAIINTVSANKPDHINIYRRLVDSHCMDERLGDQTSIDSLLRDVIHAYNKCVSNEHRIQVRKYICFL
jgi:hypothetical protein